MTTALETYEAAAETVADADKEMVCGVRMPDETDRYFVVSRDLSDEQVHEIAFSIRHGQPMDTYQKEIMRLAAERTTDSD